MPDIKYIEWGEYDLVMSELAREICLDITSDDKPLIIGMSRGGLPAATHLSHLLELPMSIINYRRLDGVNETTPELFHNHDKDIEDYSLILLVDDIHDSGHSMTICVEYMRQHNPTAKIKTVVLAQNTHYDGIEKNTSADYIGILYNTKDKHDWISFPWER